MGPSENTIDPASAEQCLTGGGNTGALMRSLDWSQTPLGPVQQWSPSLRTSVSICLNSRFPILLWWGQDLVMLYNDAYRPILGAKKHPAAMGQRGRECWPEIWHIIGPMLASVVKTGQATWSEDQLLILDRNIFPEECYFTFSYSPIREEGSGIGGVFTAVTETTRKVVSERRMETLQNLTVATSRLQTVDVIGPTTAAVLKANPADIPFALLYLHSPDEQRFELAGQAGLPADNPACPRMLPVDPEAARPEDWPLAEMKHASQPVRIDDLAERFPTLDLQVHQYPVRSALILPVTRSSQDSPYGYLIVGLNPLRPLGEGYHSFLTLIAGQVAAAIANISALAEERRRAAALAELDRAKTEFFSNISHEFRTPLTLMLGPVQDALSLPVEAITIERATLEMVNRNGLRLQKLVNTLLDFSRIEAGRLEAVFEPVDLAVLTTDLASVFRSTIERAGLTLRVDCPPLPEKVYVDRQMWEKIVLNLLSNAFKFTFEGEIEVRLRPAGRNAELSVRDTGIGIREEDISHIFERFYRVREVRARTYEGSGIGLALVKELVRLHGGTIDVYSRPGSGATFTVILPTGKAHLPENRVSGEQDQAKTAIRAAPFVEEALRWLPDTILPHPEVAPEYQAPASPPHSRLAMILAVDDNADMREYLKRLLSPRWTVETAADGQTALDIAREIVPDLVLTDVMMPEMDGFELLKELRRNTKTEEIPVILLSARAGEEARLQGLTAGADDYLVKPFSARELVARIEARLELTALRSASERRVRAILQELERSNRELVDFAFIASHDLQEPLRKIEAFGGILENRLQGKLTGEERIYFERIRQASARMSVMIEDLLAYSRVSTHPRPAKAVDPNEVVTAVLFDLEARIERSQGKVSVDDLPPLPVHPIHLRQLFQNLIGNALKFHQPGIPPEIKIYARNLPVGEDGREYVEITVEDNGIGFEQEYAERIFQPFQRLHGRSEYEGNGIGLAICRKIAKHYDGMIIAASQPGKGSRFTVTLPLTGSGYALAQPQIDSELSLR